MASVIEDPSQIGSRIDFKVPANACDCHVHVFEDPALFPFSADRLYTPGLATLDDLGRLQQRLHLDRVVIVQATPYGSDNSCMLAALDRLGDRARGIAVLEDAIGDEALLDMDRRGVRGARVNMETFGSNDPKQAAKLLEGLAERVKSLGWHLQTYTNLGVLRELGDVVRRLPLNLVIDHFGRAFANRGTDNEDFRNLLSLVDGGNVYVKLSASYRISDREDYTDVAPLVSALVGVNPERLLWGSDWPHPSPPPGRERTADGIEPFLWEDDVAALNRLAKWVPNDRDLHRILVENPQELYGF